MSMTQFAMVEELASIIKDNLFSKHLVLSTEEALINFLEDDKSLDGVLELEPMSPYHRLLLHRLADIFGFAHGSVGEGDNRHLVLERCPDTTIPSILVRDILWQYDEYQSPTSSHNILRREGSLALRLTQTLPTSTSLEEREAAYQAARERIFALQVDDEKDVVSKSRKVPVVAQRMIAHALGQRIGSTPSNQKPSQKCAPSETNQEPSIERSEDHSDSTLEVAKDATVSFNSKSASGGRQAYDMPSGKSNNCNVVTVPEKKGHGDVVSSCLSSGIPSPNAGTGKVMSIENLEKQQIGAAKRIFAHALGLPSGRGNNDIIGKPSNGNGALRRDQ